MANLGNCDQCGMPLAAVNGGIGCGDCGAPARFHPLNKQFYSAQLATAEQKLTEIRLQQASLEEQRQLWEGKLTEARAICGDGPRQPARKPIVPPQMLRPGESVVPKEAIPQHEAFAGMGLPHAAAMAGASVSVAPGSSVNEGQFTLDTNAEPLLAKSKNAAGQAILDKHGRRR